LPNYIGKVNERTQNIKHFQNLSCVCFKELFLLTKLITLFGMALYTEAHKPEKRFTFFWRLQTWHLQHWHR